MLVLAMEFSRGRAGGSRHNAPGSAVRRSQKTEQRIARLAIARTGRRPKSTTAVLGRTSLLASDQLGVLES